MVINISSSAGLFPIPLLNVYSASKVYMYYIIMMSSHLNKFFLVLKVFVNYFSAALETEYRSKGIIVQVLLPHFLTQPSLPFCFYQLSLSVSDIFCLSLSLSLTTCTQSVMPFFVATAMSGIRRPSYFAPSPSSFARAALATVGCLSSTPGCLAHTLKVRSI